MTDTDTATMTAGAEVVAPNLALAREKIRTWLDQTVKDLGVKIDSPFNLNPKPETRSYDRGNGVEHEFNVYHLKFTMPRLGSHDARLHRFIQDSALHNIRLVDIPTLKGTGLEVAPATYPGKEALSADRTAAGMTDQRRRQLWLDTSGRAPVMGAARRRELGLENR